MNGSDAQLQERVENALRQVRDVDHDMTVFDAGLIEELRIDDGRVTIEADLSQFGPGTNDEVVEAMLAAVNDVPGVEGAHVEPVAATAGDRVSIAEIDTVIAVASAKGGVGKTTVATGLACALAGENDVALFDADIYGPNVPSLLDIEGPIRANEDDQPIPISVGSLEVISVGLMTRGGPLAWRGAMAHDALTDLFENTAWDDPEVLVIDLPPGTGDVALTTLQEVPVDGVVFVTTPFQTSVEDTTRSVELFRENGIPVLGAVVNMTGYACPDCGSEHALFPGDDPTEELDVPVVARLPFTPELQEGLRPGAVPESIVALARAVDERLASVDRIEIPEDATRVDIRGLPPDRRIERVQKAFTTLNSGESFFLVSDRDPAPAGEFLVDLCDTTGDPRDVLPVFEVERRGHDEWVLMTRRP